MAIDSKLHAVWVGKHVRAMTDERGVPLPDPVFVKFGQNGGFFLSCQEALNFAQELAEAVNAVNRVRP